VLKGLREMRKMAQDTKMGSGWQRMLWEQVGAEGNGMEEKKTRGLGVKETGAEAAGDLGAARSVGHNHGPAQEG